MRIDRGDQRRSARAQARASNGRLDFAVNEEAHRRHLQFREQDPFPRIPPALLNSADIADYVSVTGMVSPFRPEHLKTASYEVALLGKWFYVDSSGNRIEGVLERGGKFILPPNSIAFMSVEPYFRLPDYIALRHNLKISHVYKGLLVGTGPLIDPGFVGKISLPLHNLTENEYTLTGGHGIIWVEFTKLSPNKNWQTRRQTVSQKGKYTSFPAEKTAAKDVADYVRDAIDLSSVPASSSAAIDSRSKQAVSVAKKAEKKVRILNRNLIVALVIGLSAALISIGGIGFNFVQYVVDVNEKISDLEERLSLLTPSSPHPLDSVDP